MMATPGSTGNN